MFICNDCSTHHRPGDCPATPRQLPDRVTVTITNDRTKQTHSHTYNDPYVAYAAAHQANQWPFTVTVTEHA